MTVQADTNYVAARDAGLAELNRLNATRNEAVSFIVHNQEELREAEAEVVRARRRLKSWWPWGLDDRLEALSAAVERRNEKESRAAENEEYVNEASERIQELTNEQEVYETLIQGSNPADVAGGELLRAVSRIAHSATAHNYGETVTAGQVINPNTVEVLMSSWPRAQEARRRLEAEGYSTADGPNRFGQWIRVWKD